ncbi:MAG: tetratricopeptide repeat protein [Pseudomonadota bacterium]|nr:tetratricopeptide repeat protein [Pseudomonadota bacterium]
MNRLSRLALALTASMMLAGAASAADPTLHEVYQAVQAGHLDQADGMMQQVLRDHPDSAKAHFVEAELLVREGRLAPARNELATAERLDPALSFAKPASVSELRQHLAQATGAAAPMVTVTPAQGGGFSWWPVLLGILALVVIVRIVRGMRPPQAPTMGNYGPGGPVGPGYGGGAPGYGAPMGPMGGGGMGSGLMGSLATGAAVGAGVVAGEALMHRVLDGSDHREAHESGLIPSADAAPMPSSGYDVGGQDFGVNDPGSWDSGGGGGGVSDVGGDDW